MNNLVLEVDAFYDTSMVRKLRMQITHEQLVEVLSKLTASENPLEIEADELLGYVKREGQMANFVKLSGKSADIERLVDLIAHRARYMDDVKSVRLSVHKLDDGDVQFVNCQKLSVC